MAGEVIDLILFCPACDHQHIDAPDTDEQYTHRLFESAWWELGGEKPERWTNPPHRSHLCRKCGHVWRPSDSFTNGVARIATEGANDSPRLQPGAKLRTLLESAYNGLRWYREQHPEDDSGADDELYSEIDEALK